MLKNKKIGIAAACALALAAWTGSTLATPVNVNGVYWDSSNQFDLTIQSLNLRETSVAAPNDVLTGYGQIGSINGINSFCTGCDLTFTFTYTLKSATATQAIFVDGSFQFYTQAAGSFDFGNPASVGGVGSTPWVTLTGRTAPRAGFADPNGQLYSSFGGTLSQPSGNTSGNGFVDVTGGPAAAYLNSNTVDDGIGGFADFNLASSFSFSPANTCAAVTTNLDDICSYPIQGNGSLTGKTTIPVPEPGAVGLLGLGLAFLGLFAWRRNKESDERA